MKDKGLNWFKIIVLLVITAGVLAFLTKIGSLVKLFIIAALLAYILDPLADFLESRGLSRMVATVIIFLGIIVIITVFIFSLLPHITHDIEAISSGVSSGKATHLIQKTEGFLQRKFSFLGIHDLNLLNRLNQFVVSTGDEVFSFFLNAVSFLTSLIIIPFIMFFLLKDGHGMKKQFISLVPNRYFEFVLNLLYKMDVQLGNYLRGQFFESLIIALLSIFALWILDVKYFFIIGTFAGLANLVPYIGPIAGAIPAIVVALLETGDISVVLYVVVAFVVIQLIDNLFVKPIVVAKSVNLHPLAVLFVVIIGGKFFGILGMLLSVPAAGVVKVITLETMNNIRKYRFA